MGFFVQECSDLYTLNSYWCRLNTICYTDGTWTLFFIFHRVIFNIMKTTMLVCLIVVMVAIASMEMATGESYCVCDSCDLQRALDVSISSKLRHMTDSTLTNISNV